MICTQLAHTQQLKAVAGNGANDEAKKKQIAAKLEQQKQERQHDKEKIQAWKVCYHTCISFY